MVNKQALKENKRPGRPQNNVLDEAIFQASIDIFAEVGFDSLSIAEVARRAGATPPAIYRRYSGKLDLVLDALAKEFEPLSIHLIDNGSLRNDLLSFIHEVKEAITTKRIRIIAGILLAGREHSELADFMAKELQKIGEGTWEEIIANAYARGELKSTSVSKVIWELPISFIINRVLLSGNCPDNNMIQELIDSVILPALQY